MKRYETLQFPTTDDDMYALMLQAFQAAISVALVPKTDEELFSEWLNEKVD